MVVNWFWESVADLDAIKQEHNAHRCHPDNIDSRKFAIEVKIKLLSQLFLVFLRLAVENLLPIFLKSSPLLFLDNIIGFSLPFFGVLIRRWYFFYRRNLLDYHFVDIFVAKDHVVIQYFLVRYELIQYFVHLLQFLYFGCFLFSGKVLLSFNFRRLIKFRSAFQFLGQESFQSIIFLLEVLYFVRFRLDQVFIFHRFQCLFTKNVFDFRIDVKKNIVGISKLGLNFFNGICRWLASLILFLVNHFLHLLDILHLFDFLGGFNDITQSILESLDLLFLVLNVDNLFILPVIKVFIQWIIAYIRQFFERLFLLRFFTLLLNFFLFHGFFLIQSLLQEGSDVLLLHFLSRFKHVFFCNLTK